MKIFVLWKSVVLRDIFIHESIGVNLFFGETDDIYIQETLSQLYFELEIAV